MFEFYSLAQYGAAGSPVCFKYFVTPITKAVSFLITANINTVVQTFLIGGRGRQYGYRSYNLYGCNRT